MTETHPFAASLPESVSVAVTDVVATVVIRRPHKRNALDDATVVALGRAFESLPPAVRAVVLDAEGDNFSAGLDLSELSETTLLEGVEHSRMWHRTMDRIEGAGVPVIAVLRGAVIGGGLELACAAHLRVAEASAFYALPEGQRGLFVGGGGSVRIPRLIGAARMADMMLTGRVLDANEGQAVGLSHYLVPAGQASAKAYELARRVASNSPVSNFAVLQVLPRIAESGVREGLVLESLMAAVAQASDEAKARMQAFLAGRAGRVTDGSGQ